LKADPSDEVLRGYYESLDLGLPFEAVKKQLIVRLRQRRFEKAKAAYMLSLRNKAKIVISLPPPRAVVDLKNTPLRGAGDARVVVVEFADYECPYSQQVNPALQKRGLQI
jgi:protein-disulfide isomerase